MTRYLQIGFVILVWVIYSQGVEYHVLSTWTSGSCPSRDNCQLMGNLSFEERNCECDRFCSAFKDCCVDAPTAHLLYTSISNTCMPYGKDSSLGAYVVGNCPSDYSGPKSVKDFCEGQDDFHNFLFSIPVTDILTNVTFRNRYCAVCNSDVTSSLKTWLISMKFKNLPVHCHNEEYVWKYLNFNLLQKEWGIHIASHFYPVVFSFYKPDFISSVRQCRVNLISSCPPHWRKIEVKKVCSMYTSVVYALEKSYRNIQCATCNGVKAKDLSCTKGPGKTKIQDDLPFAFEMMVDLSSMDDTKEGNIKKSMI